MRGSPPFHLLLLAVAFALVALPLTRLTCGREADRSTETVPSSSARQVVRGMEEHPEGEHAHQVATRVRVYFAHAPQKVSLMAGEKELLKAIEWAGSEAPVETEVELEIGHDGNELVLEAAWPDGTPLTAVTIELEPEGLEARSETRWAAEGGVSDVLTFVW